MEAKRERDMAAEADAAAFREALGETVNISVKKERGSAAFLPCIEATSAPAALNGIAVLIREYAAMVGLSPVSVLAVLATVIAMPAIRKQQVEKQEEA